MKYTVVIAEKASPDLAMFQLRGEVNRYIREGWKPLGGVSVTYAVDNCFMKTIIAQAMIKE